MLQPKKLGVFGHEFCISATTRGFTIAISRISVGCNVKEYAKSKEEEENLRKKCKEGSR